jgi:hypothetical protein
MDKNNNDKNSKPMSILPAATKKRAATGDGNIPRKESLFKRRGWHRLV